MVLVKFQTEFRFLCLYLSNFNHAFTSWNPFYLSNLCLATVA